MDSTNQLSRKSEEFTPNEDEWTGSQRATTIRQSSTLTLRSPLHDGVDERCTQGGRM